MEDVGKGITRLESLILGLDKKLDQRFMWMIGLQFAILVASIGGMFGIVTKLLPS
jgi:hypothetical protein